MRNSRREVFKLAGAGGLAMISAPAFSRGDEKKPVTMASFDHLVTRHKTVKVGGLDIFYREAGKPDAPAILLLHGFPTSSHMFRHLIPALAENYRVVAPDYPGFGFSAFPARDQFQYSFSAIAKLIAGFTDAVGLNRYALFIQDYGAPIGLRLALDRPQAVRALISQNGNLYEEGLSPAWAPIKAYWADRSEKNREALRAFLNEGGIRFQYSAGVPKEQIERVAPDNWVIDWARMQRPGNIEVQLDLLGDYGSNVELYPRFQEYLRTRRPPTLIIWGRNDPLFTVEGAKAFRRDLPDAEVELVNAGHFLLETHGPHSAHRIDEFLREKLKS